MTGLTQIDSSHVGLSGQISAWCAAAGLLYSVPLWARVCVCCYYTFASKHKKKMKKALTGAVNSNNDSEFALSAANFSACKKILGAKTTKFCGSCHFRFHADRERERTNIERTEKIDRDRQIDTQTGR